MQNIEPACRQAGVKCKSCTSQLLHSLFYILHLKKALPFERALI